MQKFKILILCLGLSTSLWSQYNAGRWFGTANINASYSSGNFDQLIDGNLDTNSTSGSSRLSAGLSLSANYLVASNFSLGFGLSYQHQETQQKVSQSTVWQNLNSSFSAHILARQYVPISRKLAYFTQATVSYSYSREQSKQSLPNEAPNFNPPSNRQSISLAFSPGLSYMLTSRMAAEMSFGSLYFRHSRTVSKASYQQEEIENRSQNSSLGINMGLSSLNLGLVVFLN